MTGPGNQRLERRLAQELGREQAQRLARTCPPIDRTSDRSTSIHYRLHDRSVVSLCSNDYLGFADDLGVSQPTVAGSGASRLVCGDLDEHRTLERDFAEFLGLPDALLFPSGFQANVGVPACLLRADDLVSSDELNHASIIDGLRLASAERRVIPHGTRPSPARVEGHGEGGLHWWFTESVFSMDGDGPTLADLAAHLDEGGCVYLDEAHALGLHEHGRGRAAGLPSPPTLIVAPLGKAFGCAGAIVAGSVSVCTWIRAHARSFVFTTGLSPVLMPRLARALALVRGPIGDERRARLWRNVAVLRRALALPDLALFSPILPMIIGANHDALALSQQLFERGWHVQAIRPPTVPEGSARLRITVSAMHEVDELERFAADLLECRPASGDQQ